MGKFRNTPAFVHWDYVMPIELGESYLCIIRQYNSVYYAYPLHKIDMSAVISVSPDLRAEIFDRLWKKNKKAFENEFESRYLKETEAAISERLRAEHIKEIEAKDEDIKNLREEIRSLRTQVIASEAAASSRQLTSEINLSSEEVVLTSDEETNQTADASPNKEHLASSEIFDPPSANTRMNDDLSTASDPFDPMFRKKSTFQYTVRITSDTLYCDSFVSGEKYFVHVSPDLRKILVRPNEDGTVTCNNKGLRLLGLNMVYGSSNQQMESMVIAEYSERYHGMLINL